ncbi:hypothetical protein DL95DRAFT_317638, partial [Leptodontidium sp. 2 PMI_412]
LIKVILRVEGFIIFDYISQYPEALKELAQGLAEGKLQRKETIILGGLEIAERALVALYQGINTGIFFCPNPILYRQITG